MVGYRILILGVLSLLLMFFDHRFDYLNKVRSAVGTMMTPVYWLADAPVRLWNWSSENLTSRESLQEDNIRLNIQLMQLKQTVLKLESLSVENRRLRELLNSSRVVDDNVLVAEIIAFSPDPHSHWAILNKGSTDNVYEGQAVLDADGLVGQVIEVTPFTSRTLFITDTRHAVPVRINRNDVRAIAIGTGNLERLDLPHVPDTADIQKGDILLSSGLGQRFPPGYPVATITQVIHDPGRQFAFVQAQPTAQLDSSRYVLLVFSDDYHPQDNRQQQQSEHESVGSLAATEALSSKRDVSIKHLPGQSVVQQTLSAELIADGR